MLEIIRANSENEAINVALIHSNEAGAKLRAERQILEGLPPSVTATDLLSLRRILARAQSPALELWAVGQFIGGSQRAIASVSADPSAAIVPTPLPDRHRIILPTLTAGEPPRLRIRYSP